MACRYGTERFPWHFERFGMLSMAVQTKLHFGEQNKNHQLLIFWKIFFHWYPVSMKISSVFMFFPCWPRLRRSWSPKRLRWSFLVNPPKLKLYEAFLSNFSMGYPTILDLGWRDAGKHLTGWIWWSWTRAMSIENNGTPISSAKWQVDRFTVGYHNPHFLFGVVILPWTNQPG